MKRTYITSEYFLGLDMGTNSVGWAVTDKNYNLLRFRGKDMWGIREFEEARGAVERRSHRVSRRRLQREKARIGLLKEYFADAIEKIDPEFYIRLDNSKYFVEDKDVAGKNGIFNDSDYDDKKYYEEYPTIFHLRKELICNPNPHDVRLVYLAILNLFKRRGNFLNDTLSISGNSRKIKDIYIDIVNSLQEISDVSFGMDVDYEKFENIISSRDFSRSRKAEQINELLGVERSEKQKTQIIRALCGLSVNASKMLGDDFVGQDDVAICFTSSSFDEKKDEIDSVVGEEWAAVIDLLKELFDAGSLASVLKGYDYLSESRVADYEKHKKDLKVLKSLYYQFGTKEEYDKMFRSEADNTYSAYVNSFNSDVKHRRNVKGRKMEDLYSTIKKQIEKWNKEGSAEGEDVDYVLNEIEKETFLPKQLTSANGVIPNQVHMKELKKILENARVYLPFLNEVDESGLAAYKRIEKLFGFHIPYYIGPVSTRSAAMGGNGWVVRKEEGQVLPWNINDKIDMQKTSEEFIKRLIRKCSYLDDERVMPKSSLIYERFRVLNEINNLKINNKKITVELKQNIYNDLFKSGKKVTRAKLVSYLANVKKAINDEAELSGIDITINNHLATYGKFKAVFGDKIEEDHYKEIAEDIVYYSTIYGDSKALLNKVINEKYGDELDQSTLKRLLSFKFKDWGRLSKEFLELQGCDKETGEMISLIHALWETNDNMMELLHSERFSFGEELAKKQSKSLGSLSDFSYEDLQDMYFSAPVKRMIWQTILLIKEIEKITGTQPARVFLEMTRQEDDKKERTQSRREQLLECYKAVKKEYGDFIDEINKADEDGSLKSKKLFLYYSQLGCDLYTGEHINLYDLMNSNDKYDIDHIHPQHFVKDDNISNNLALVSKDINNRKQDIYPLPDFIRINPKVIALWNRLHDLKLMNDEKFNRLRRNFGFTEEEMAGFIARQIVQTSQGTKGISDLLEQLIPETTIVYSKARNVSDFRQKYELPKSRLINDFHHANDAYLNIVVGNAYYVKFTKNPLLFIRNEYLSDKKKNNYNLGDIFDFNIKRGEEVAWVSSKKDGDVGTIKIVKDVMQRNTPILTRLCIEGHGGLTNATVYGASSVKDKGYIPLKSSDEKLQDIHKYGGLTSVSTAYLFVVEHDLKKKRVRTIETVPLYLKDAIEKDETALERYCLDDLCLINPLIRVRKISLQSLLRVNGYYAHITGSTGDRYYLRNATAMCLEPKWVRYIKKLEKYVETGNLDKDINIEDNLSLYNELSFKHNNGIFTKRPNPMGSNLSAKREIFDELSIEAQATVLYRILQLTAICLTKANLTDIGLSTATGVMLLGKNITGNEEMLLINQSITGLFINTINLLTV